MEQASASRRKDADHLVSDALQGMPEGLQALMLRRLYRWLRGWRRQRITALDTNAYLYWVGKGSKPIRIFYTTTDGEIVSKEP